MPRYTEEQIARANETDLVSFLRARGEKLKKSGKEYRWMKHDSLTVDHNEWYRFSGSKGGHGRGNPFEEETSTGRKSNPSHKNVRCGRKSSAVVMVSIYPIWKSNADPGKSGKRKNMACNGTLCILYSRERTSKCASNRTIQCLLPDRRGRSWRYDQAKTCKMWSRYDKSSFYQ